MLEIMLYDIKNLLITKPYKEIKNMKQKISLQYKKVNILCACGKSYEIKSTKTYNTDICSSCHPLFTGSEKILDVEGRIEKFQMKYNYKKAIKMKTTINM
jgi:large subunit ribosomal protein L31